MQNVGTTKLCGITFRKTIIVTFTAMKLDLQNFNKYWEVPFLSVSFIILLQKFSTVPATYPLVGVKVIGSIPLQDNCFP